MIDVEIAAILRATLGHETAQCKTTMSNKRYTEEELNKSECTCELVETNQAGGMSYTVANPDCPFHYPRPKEECKNGDGFECYHCSDEIRKWTEEELNKSTSKMTSDESSNMDIQLCPKCNTMKKFKGDMCVRCQKLLSPSYRPPIAPSQNTDWEEEFDIEFTNEGSFKVYGTPDDVKAFIKRQISKAELAMNKLCNAQAEESINQLSRELNKVNKENKMLKADIAYAIGRFKGLNLQCFYLERRYPKLNLPKDK